MKNNGIKLIEIISRESLQMGIWDPFFYRNQNSSQQLSDYVDIIKINGKRYSSSDLKYEPLEYRDISKGYSLSFSLRRFKGNKQGKFNIVGEQVLLFGTMRAYLGNVCVTPKASWIQKESPIVFPINSEFVQITPKDGFLYFWWAFLQSPSFLNMLPTGSGGTRPRVKKELLSNTPVEIPTLEQREEIHKKLILLAEHEWKNFCNKEKIISTL